MSVKLTSARFPVRFSTHFPARCGILSAAAEPALRFMRFVRFVNFARCVRALRLRLDIIDKAPTS